MFIKIFDEQIANQLVSNFSYVKETDNGKEIYVFLYSEELHNFLLSNYDQKEFVVENKLRF